MPRKSLRERLEAKIDSSGGSEACWPWKGVDWLKNYGKIRDDQNTLQRAHRMVWEVFVGPIPEGLGVLHTCDHPGCCNRVHLFLGSQEENIADMDRKGRRSRHSSSSLSEETLQKIWNLLEAGVKWNVVSHRLNISSAIVWRIKEGITYSAGATHKASLGKFRHISGDIVEEIQRELQGERKTYVSLAEKYHVDPEQVARIDRGGRYGKMVGGKRYRGRLTSDQVIMIKSLYSQGLNQQKVADRLKTTQSTISRVLLGKSY